jgi:hypothetical protein
MVLIVRGKPPPADEPAKQEYLRKKLAEMRKNCQWLAVLGAGEVFGALLKDALGSTSPPGLRLAVFLTSGAQILVAIVGGFSWHKIEVDKSQVLTALERRLEVRYWLRNISFLLLVVSFVLIAVLVLHGSPPRCDPGREC